MARTQAEISSIFTKGTTPSTTVSDATQAAGAASYNAQKAADIKSAGRPYEGKDGNIYSGGTSMGPPIPSSASPALISASIMTSNVANEHKDTIQTNLNEITAGIQNQQTTVANNKALADAANNVKTEQDAQAKIAADKNKVDKQNADSRSTAVAAASKPNLVGTQVDPNPIRNVSDYGNNTDWKNVRYENGNTQVSTLNTDGTYTPVSQAEISANQNQAQLDKISTEYEDKSNAVSKTIADIQAGVIPLNAGEQAQLTGLQQSFQQLIDQQKLINTSAKNTGVIRGYQKGAAENSPMFAVNMIGSIVTAGANKVADWNIKMASAVADLTQSFKDNDIKNIKSAWDVYSTMAEKRASTLQKTIDNAQAQIKATQDAKAKVTEDINGIVKDAAKNGAPLEVQHAIARSGSVNAAIGAAGDYLQSGTGIVGEYTYYVRDAQARELTPLSFDDYQTRDANRNLAAAKAVNAAGLTAALTNTALKLSDDYEARSKDYYTQRDAYNRVVSSAKDPSAAGDLALIFNYMKTLDPNSTVREGEFATAQNSGSAFQRVGALYNKVISGERLTDIQRKDFVTRAKTLFEGAKKQQDSVVEEFNKRSEQYGVPANLVVRDTQATGNVGQDAIQEEEDAKASFIEYGKMHPEDKKMLKALVVDVDPELGRPLTYSEAMQVLNSQ